MTPQASTQTQGTTWQSISLPNVGSASLLADQERLLALKVSTRSRRQGGEQNQGGRRSTISDSRMQDHVSQYEHIMSSRRTSPYSVHSYIRFLDQNVTTISSCGRCVKCSPVGQCGTTRPSSCRCNAEISLGQLSTTGGTNSPPASITPMPHMESARSHTRSHS